MKFIKEYLRRNFLFLLHVKFKLNFIAWDNISIDVKDLISNMLTDPDKRFSAQQVLNHNWVVYLAPNSLDCVLNLNIEALKNYTKSNKFKKAALTFIASRLKDDEIKMLKDIFITIDKNNDGTLTLEEVLDGCQILGSNLNMLELFTSIDTDKSGTINYTEFIAATIDQKIYLKQERLFEAFKNFDKDNSGKISIKEIAGIINANHEDYSKLEQDINKFDLNGDGEIDYYEFCNMMGKVEIN